MKAIRVLFMFFVACCFSPLVAEDSVPKTVTALWADFDPRKDPLARKPIAVGVWAV